MKRKCGTVSGGGLCLDGDHLDVKKQQWQYFRFEVSATQGYPRVNLGDIEIEY